MPELGLYGSVRGALSNERPYRDSMGVLRILTHLGHWPAAFAGMHGPESALRPAEDELLICNVIV